MPGKRRSRIKWFELGLGGVSRAKNQSMKEYMKLVNASRTAKSKHIRKQCHLRYNKLAYRPRKYDAVKAKARRTRKNALKTVRQKAAARTIKNAFSGFTARLKARRAAAPMSLRDEPALSAV